MAPVTNKELASKLRAMARSAKNENVRHILTESANRLEKPGHKQTPKKAAVLYSVWDNRTDKLIALDLPEKDCLELMKIGHAGFMKAIREGSKRWKIEKRFADEPDE